MNDSPARIASKLGALPDALAAALAGRATVLAAKRGRVVIPLESRSDAVYVVLEGRVQVALYSAGGREVILRDLVEGDMFGELSAIDGLPRSASVVALSDCRLASIDAAGFRDAIVTVPEATLWLAQRLTHQIRNLTARVLELNALTVRSRLHCELLRMCPAGAGPSATIAPSPTHAELASRVGTHREAITRELGYLAQQGIVDQHKRRITVTDVAALAQLVRAATGEEPGGVKWGM